MKRRGFLLGAASSLSLLNSGPISAQNRTLRRIAYLRATNYQETDLSAFKQGLSDLGWREGENIVLDVQHASGNIAQLPSLAASVASRHPEVIVVDGDLTVRAAVQAAPRVPVVFTLVTDPLRLGLANSLSQPGGYVTGQTGFSLDLTAKRVSILKQALPMANRLAVIVQSGPAIDLHRAQIEETARTHGITPTFFSVDSVSSVDSVISAVGHERPDAVMTLYSPIFYSQRELIVRRLREQRLPGMHPEREFVVAGGMMSYGVEFATLWRRSANYVDRILKGAQAAELPIEQPSRILLSINTITARQLGIEIPLSVLAFADEVID